MMSEGCGVELSWRRGNAAWWFIADFPIRSRVKMLAVGLGCGRELPNYWNRTVCYRA